MPLAGPTRDAQERFWEKVNKTDSCWLWTGSVNSGYGWFHAGDLTDEYRAHRVSWVIHFGPVPDDLWVLHHCDVPICVRPDHLYIGTQDDNETDKVVRQRAVRGSDVNGSKLTEAQAREILTRFANGEKMLRIAPEYGVSFTAVWALCRRKTWKHLD